MRSLSHRMLPGYVEGRILLFAWEFVIYQNILELLAVVLTKYSSLTVGGMLITRRL